MIAIDILCIIEITKCRLLLLIEKENILMTMFNSELDASGLNCPLPILRAKKSLSALESGDVLHIIATDPGSVKDFESFVSQTGNELLESTTEDGKFNFFIKKK